MSASSRLLVRLLALALLALPSIALAAVPQYITYSGRVLDEFGEAVEGEVVLTVGIFKEVTDATTEDGLGNASWTDDFTTIVINGYFSIVLGSQAVLAAADLTGDDVWVALSIDNGPWMVPASQLTSAPFALQAETADTATVAETANAVDGPVVAETVTVGGTTVIDVNGNWTGPIETTSAAKVGSLWVDGVLIIDNNNWVGPAPDLPSGTAVNGTEILVGTNLESQIDTQINAFVGVEQDSNPLNHERYQGRDELLMEIENVGAVTSLPSYAEEYLYHAPVTANDVVSDLQSTFVDLSGDTMTGDLVVEGTVSSKGTNDETDATAVTPGAVAFSLAPDPNGSGTSIIDTWQIEATETSFVIKDFQGSATEYVVIEENASGVGLITLQPEGNASVSVAAASVDIAPSGSSGSSVTSAANFTQDTVSLVNTSVGPALEVTEGQVSANLNSNTNVLNLTQTGVSIGAAGVPTTVVGDLSVQGDVNLTSQQILGTLTVEADNSLDAEELNVSSTGVSITGSLDVTDTSNLAATNVVGNASVTGDTTMVGGLVINNSSRDTVTINGSTADIVLPVTVDANDDNFDELAISTNLVEVDGELTANPGDSTVEFQVAESGVTVRDNLTVASGGATITQGGLLVSAGGVEVTTGGLKVDDGNLTVGVNADSLNEVAIDDTGMTVSGDLTVTGTINGNVSGSVSTSAITATAGNLTVTQDLDNTAELAITDAGATFNDAVTVSTGDVTLTTGGVTASAGTVSAATLAATGAITTGSGNLVVGANNNSSAALTATDSGVTVRDGLTVSTGGIGVTDGGLAVTAGGINVTAGGLQVDDGNLVIAPNSDNLTEVTIGETEVTMAGDLTVTGTINGNISGSISTTSITASTGNLTVTADNDGTTELAVDNDGVVVQDKLEVATGNLTVTTGDIAMTAGNITASSGTVTAAELVASAGNLTVTDSSDSTASMALTDSMVSINHATDIDGGLTINDGGITVTTGGIGVTAGGVQITAGGLEVTDGNLTVGPQGDSTASMALTDSAVSINHATDIDGGLTINDGGIGVTTGGLTVSAGTTTASGGLTVNGGAVSITNAVTSVDVNQNLSVDADSDNTDELLVANNALTITADTTLSGGTTDLFVGGQIYGSSTSTAPSFDAGINVDNDASLDADGDGTAELYVGDNAVDVNVTTFDMNGATLDMHGGTIGYSTCPTNYSLISTNFCADEKTTAQSFPNAMEDCFSEGAHLCDGGEMLYLNTQDAFTGLDNSSLDFWISETTGEGSSHGNDYLFLNVDTSDENDDLQSVSDTSAGSKRYICCMTPN